MVEKLHHLSRLKKMSKKIYNYALNPDKETLKQFKNCYDEKFVTAAALMPDAHRGYVAPIGSVLVTKDYVVPSWVGYDIGCGMTAVKIKDKEVLKEIKDNAEKIHKEIKKLVPMGLGKISQENQLSQESKEKFKDLLEDLKKKPVNKNIINFLESGKAERHLGSLGQGNHFIELDEYNDQAWIVVHSGSRGVGHHIAEVYMKKSANKKVGFEETYPLSVESIAGKEYLAVLDFALEFALLNRLEIIKRTIQGIEKTLNKKMNYSLWVNKNHNHAIKESGKYVHRKGATPAKFLEKGVIPANMRDGSFLVIGKGNRKFLKSSSHGAGRKLGRKEAKQKLSLEKMKSSMKGIVSESKKEFLDESPEAYKDIFEVLEAQKRSIKVLRHLKPVINWKG